jgi:branched-chain amino acid transport system ATP-binding protein
VSFLEVEGLRVAYGAIEAVRGVSLTVDDGEIVTLIGGNGAGKTTTLRTICGLKSPSAGRVTFDGTDVTGSASHDLVARGMALVPEGRHIFPNMTVFENLEMGAYLRIKQDLTEDLARVFSLFPVLEQRRTQAGGTLSGGEQQMLAIGRALMARPRLLLLDEPSLGLAPIMVQTIFGIIREIHEQGTSVLLIEQNAQQALQTAARGYVMETGEIVLADDAAALLGNDDVRKAYLGGE